MSFRTQRNVFTVLAEGRKGKMQTKANVVPLRGALRATCKLSVPKQSQMPKFKPKPISTLFNKILHISSHFITAGGAVIRLPNRKRTNHRVEIQNQSQFRLH